MIIDRAIVKGQTQRVKFRVVKWRARLRGWKKCWKVIQCISAYGVILLAMIALYLLLKLSFATESDYVAFIWSSTLTFWPDFIRPSGFKAAVVPEPSRCVLLWLALFITIFRRRRMAP